MVTKPPPRTSGFPDMRGDFTQASGILEQIVSFIQNLFTGDGFMGFFSKLLSGNFSLSSLFESAAPAGEGDPAAAPRAASINLPATTVLTLGDSISAGLGPQITGVKEVINEGVNGKGLINSDGTLQPVSTVAGLDKIKPGTITIVSMGTNDIAELMLRPQLVQPYADHVAQLAEEVKKRGGIPVVLDVRQNTGAYTEGGEKWKQEGFADRWNAMALQLNTALKTTMDGKQITFAETNGKVEIRSDHLHPTDTGDTAIYEIVKQSLGITPAKP